MSDTHAITSETVSNPSSGGVKSVLRVRTRSRGKLQLLRGQISLLPRSCLSIGSPSFSHGLEVPLGSSTTHACLVSAPRITSSALAPTMSSVPSTHARYAVIVGRSTIRRVTERGPYYLHDDGSTLGRSSIAPELRLSSHKMSSTLLNICPRTSFDRWVVQCPATDASA